MKAYKNPVIFITQYIFARPLLASLFVGTAIHTFFYINQMLAMGHSYLYSQWTLVENHPVFGIGQLAIPYMVPFIFTRVGGFLSGIKQQELMRKFVELNPDIVILLDEQLNVEFANPSTYKYLRRLKLPADAIHKILPANYQTIISKRQHKAFKLAIDSPVHDRVFSFSIRRTIDSPNVFITGRDTTEKYNARSQLERATATFQQLTDYLDDTFREYDPNTFNLDSHFDNLIEAIMLGSEQNSQSPSHLLMASIEENWLNGHIYHLENGRVIRDPQLLEIDLLRERHSIIDEQRSVILSNWDDETASIEKYQERFHPMVRSKIGNIDGFASCQSNGIAVVGFYQDKKVSPLDCQVIKAFTVVSSSLKRISEESRQTLRAFDYTMDALARASEANDEDTGDHIVRLNEYARVIAIELGCEQTFVDTIHRSAQMHDVGKIHINPAILKKSGKLTSEEFEQMKLHPIYGAKILGDSPHLTMAAEIALNHHEKFNGKGYPNGIQGEEIPLSARIVAIIDVYDALRQKRVYKPAFSHQKSLSIISEGDGRTSPDEFDPRVLQAFINTADQLEKIFDSYQE